jgi:hypothetical protein
MKKSCACYKTGDVTNKKAVSKAFPGSLTTRQAAVAMQPSPFTKRSLTSILSRRLAGKGAF